MGGKVYVVTEAHWPDSWEVIAAFDSQEKAKAAIPAGDGDAAGDGCYTVTELELQTDDENTR